MAHVMIAGATGYLGRYLVKAFLARGYHVSALVRPASKADFPDGVRVIYGEATKPETLYGVFDGVELVVSSLGLTRQTDKLSYDDVDYQANLNLLRAAEVANVQKFAYVHVLTRTDARSELVQAKSRFVTALQASSIASLVVRPGGYFVDIAEVFNMARSGRVWMVGDGALKINPIHGADLAKAIADAVEAGEVDIEVGGPEILSMDDVAKLAFATLRTTPKITYIPAWILRVVLRVVKPFAPRHIWGPFELFLAAASSDMVAPPHGQRRLADFFAELAAQPSA
ncbi:Uncharacterized conserved protein YbjT, contains NAD(P)-binding and DUF2867 domains [Aliiroseovarius halocynthiae]|uniref:SDR family oxidoreductase n=1 Tax=Aliiroseovarius halocynthiae TaxID=985055 RepID=A0A545SZM9_9RHOB|nr:SDR family oxidoreductase [Aliiroseovarius halocynthiae]TQV70438.1 SDR family oxidoreductase [Aliiroseovarius halocynthiae]SMR81845.1 Uncharacterized conserved protein YbjT, contains NAD(P)-binding and DUF2867 domains [Aliiroseovarius halocynthiae]